jgi:hypothetical protein
MYMHRPVVTDHAELDEIKQRYIQTVGKVVLHPKFFKEFIAISL